MQAERRERDWRDAAAYSPLLGADRTLFAWEWLRRDPRYRTAAANHCRTDCDGAGQFGLVRYELPEFGVPHARPLWSSNVHSAVLQVVSTRSGNAEDIVVLEHFSRFSSLVVSEAAEHLLLSDGLRCIRLDGPSGAFSRGPLFPRYLVAGVAAAGPPLMTLRRFLALYLRGGFSRSLHPRERRAPRWIQMLRAHDAMVAGASQREIARELLVRRFTESRWRSTEPSLRSQAQRLVRSARVFANGGYRMLLR